MTSTLTPLERSIGDLDHPWYADERTRFLSYEIYTVAAQAALFTSTALALCMAWSGDKKIAGWGCAVLATSYLPTIYAGSRIQRLMDVDQRHLKINVRGLALLILYVATVTGFFVTFSGTKDPLSTAFGSGALWGGLAGTATTLVYGWWKTKQADKNQPDPADIPDED